MGTIKRAIKSDLEDIYNYFRYGIPKLFVSVRKSLSELFHIHRWIHESTERGEITLFKNLYEANGWDRSYTIKYYRCSKCGAYKSDQIKY